VELALRDVDGTVGRIAIRGPMLLRAYRDGTTPLDEDGWLVTNDLGSLDVDGALHIHGRVDDVINSGGEKVWPDLVERILTAHRSIAEAAVIGVTDAEWGQRVVAVLVGRAGTDRPSLAELRDLVRAELPVAAAPRQLWWVDELPRTAIGKLRRAELRDRWRSAFEQTL
jgi:acyl-CoA synthetase (AMP-forming)/AMP-acid ligase II